MRGKINANLHSEQRQTALRRVPLRRLLYWDLAETLTHLDMKRSQSGMTSQTLVCSSSG